jgi:hypothetical protein
MTESDGVFNTNQKNFFRARKDIQEGNYISKCLENEDCEPSQNDQGVHFPIINNK